MRAYFRELDENMSRFLTPVVKWITYLCCITFLATMVYQPLVRILGASPYSTILRLHVWQFFTYAFAHGGVWHLLFNILALGMFGCRLEQRWGSERFLRFSVVVIAGSVLTHLLFMLLMGSVGSGDWLMQKIIGISGMVYAVLLVFAIYSPDLVVLFMGIFPMKVKFMVGLLGVMAFVGAYDPRSPTAHLTHLGGMLFGYLFYRYPHIFDRLPLPRFLRRDRFRPRSRWDL